MPDSPSKREKFRQTRELMRIALEDGMTQEEIARICRVQQSVVSNWSRGKSKAYHDQVKSLMTRYGARLQRSSARIYLLATEPDPNMKWEDSEIWRKVQELTALWRELSEDIRPRKETTSTQVSNAIALFRKLVANTCPAPGSAQGKSERLAKSRILKTAGQASTAELSAEPETRLKDFRAILDVGKLCMSGREIPDSLESEAGSVDVTRAATISSPFQKELAELEELIRLFSIEPALLDLPEHKEFMETLHAIQGLCSFGLALEQAERARSAAFERSHQELAESIGLPGNISLDEITKAAKASFVEHISPLRMVQIEGQIIFRHVFTKLENHLTLKYLESKPIPLHRWILHQLPDGHLALVSQTARKMVGTRLLRVTTEANKANIECTSIINSIGFRGQWAPRPLTGWVESSVDPARWLSTIEGPFTVTGFLEYVDRYLGDRQSFHSPNDEVTLPFLVRMALVEHGYSVPELVRFPGVC